MENKFEVGKQVVRMKGGYTGRIGVIIEIDSVAKRARVRWHVNNMRTWVAFHCLELTLGQP